MGGQTVHVVAPPRVTSNPNGQVPEDAWFVPYWWVGTTDNEGMANMKMVAGKVGEVTFPILQNSQAIKPFEKLLL